MFIFVEELLGFVVGLFFEVTAEILDTALVELGVRGLILPFSSDRPLP